MLTNRHVKGLVARNLISEQVLAPSDVSLHHLIFQFLCIEQPTCFECFLQSKIGKGRSKTTKVHVGCDVAQHRTLSKGLIQQYSEAAFAKSSSIHSQIPRVHTCIEGVPEYYGIIKAIESPAFPKDAKCLIGCVPPAKLVHLAFKISVAVLILQF